MPYTQENKKLCIWLIPNKHTGGDSLGIVNADANELLQSWNNIKTAITSIETTKSSMMRKYQQLNGEWKDKKYKELGNVVQECSRALNDILKILSQGEKFVGSLAKSLQEYDNVNLDGRMSSDNAFVQSLRNMTYSAGETPSYQYCLGVLTRGNIPDGYLDIISQRHDSGDNRVRRVFDNFVNQCLIQNANYPPSQTAHYSPMNYEGHRRGVYYNATSDMSNPRGDGTTYFHELAHMIDHAATGYQGNISNNPEFRQALLADGQDALNRYNSAGEEGQRHFRNNLRQNNRTHSFQDLLEGSTNGNLSFYWGHNRPDYNYWAREGNLEAEAFAHFFEASMGASDKLELLALWFPRATTVFFNMMEGLIGNQPQLVRSR